MEIIAKGKMARAVMRADTVDEAVRFQRAYVQGRIALHRAGLSPLVSTSVIRSDADFLRLPPEKYQMLLQDYETRERGEFVNFTQDRLHPKIWNYMEKLDTPPRTIEEVQFRLHQWIAAE